MEDELYVPTDALPDFARDEALEAIRSWNVFDENMNYINGIMLMTSDDVKSEWELNDGPNGVIYSHLKEYNLSDRDDVDIQLSFRIKYPKEKK